MSLLQVCLYNMRNLQQEKHYMTIQMICFFVIRPISGTEYINML